MNTESQIHEMKRVLEEQVRDRTNDGISVRFECDPPNALTSNTIVIRALVNAPPVKAAGLKPLARCVEAPEFAQRLKKKAPKNLRKAFYFEAKFPAKELGPGSFHLVLVPASGEDPIGMCNLRIHTKSSVAEIRKKLIRVLHGHTLERPRAKPRRRPVSKRTATRSSSRKRR